MKPKFKLLDVVYAKGSNGGQHKATIVEITSSGGYQLRWFDGSLSRGIYSADDLVSEVAGNRERNSGPPAFDFLADRFSNYAGPS
jgi:uncharacterized protein YodC (DUF2158 family)